MSRRAVSARKKKERELTIQEKRAVAERVMEAATRRRDAILLQRAQCTDSPQPSLADRCVEQLATEVADAVIEHALLDQRMLRASALQSREESPDLVRRRRDHARQMLAAQMGLASRRKAALASQQDRGALGAPPFHTHHQPVFSAIVNTSMLVLRSCSEPRSDCKKEGRETQKTLAVRGSAPQAGSEAALIPQQAPSEPDSVSPCITENDHGYILAKFTAHGDPAPPDAG